jgi:predicted enzyme related to lactoylglutathione lyase
MADSSMPGMTYSILKAGDVMVGGMMPIPAGSGLSPMWTGYIYSPDVDADAKRAEKLGGKVCRAPDDIPGVGRFAVIADPGGAMFNLFKPNSDQRPADVPLGTPGHIGWRELQAGDGEKAFAFYSSLFGWTKDQAIDMGPIGIYQIFAINGKMAGGMMTKTPDTPQAHWLYYFNTDAIGAAGERVKKAGGQITSGPMQVPGGDWVAHARDPQGAAFALVSQKK